MSVLRCRVCEEETVARTIFEEEGSCPNCGADDSLVKDDAYDPQTRELQCAECGWEVEAGVELEWAGRTRTFSVDDDCPVCEAAGRPGLALEPADAVAAPEEQPDYARARAAAVQLRSETMGDGLPVDVEEIAIRCGLSVTHGLFEHDGLLRGKVIEVPTQRGHRPGRFVIAHELGHHTLGHESGRNKIEPEANAFASELLIPRQDLGRLARPGSTIRGLADRFDVSQEALVHALGSAKLLNRISG